MYPRVRNCLLLLLTLSATFVSGQNAPSKFGDIDMKAMEMKFCPADSGAAAMVLFEFGYASFNLTTGANLELETQVRIKIFSKDGYDYANVKIPHHPKKGITRFKASTFNLENGKITEYKVKSADQQDEVITENLSHLKFSFPNVKEGSIIEYQYRVELGSITELTSWNFQWSIPVRWDEFIMVIPSGFNYKFLTQGYTAFSIATRKPTFQQGSLDATLHRWVQKDVPAMKTEPLMPPSGNFVSRIEFELQNINIPGVIYADYVKSWEQFAHDLLEDADFGKSYNNVRFIREEMQEFLSGDLDTLGKAAAILRHIANNMSWNEYTGIWASQPLRKSWGEKKGSAADINLLLLGALQEAGFPARPVLLSTRGNGIIKDKYRPVLKNFDYVVVLMELNGRKYLLDATEPLLPFGMLPERCMNGEGWLVAESRNPVWVNLLGDEKKYRYTMGNLNIEEGGVLTGELSSREEGYHALTTRRKLKTDGEENYLEDLKKNNMGWTIESHEFQNTTDPGQPFTEKYRLSIDNRVEDFGDIVYLNPMVINSWADNPFKMENRTYPVDFVCPVNETYLMNIILPENYSVSSLPEPVIITMPGDAASFSYRVSQSGSLVQVISQLQLKKPLYYVQEYVLLKNFFSLIVAKQQEQLVLKKTAP